MIIYTEKIGIPKERVLLMPMSQTIEEHTEILRKIWDVAVTAGLRVTPRLHIAAGLLSR